jgi:hypothetical protein
VSITDRDEREPGAAHQRWQNSAGSQLGVACLQSIQDVAIYERMAYIDSDETSTEMFITTAQVYKPTTATVVLVDALLATTPDRTILVELSYRPATVCPGRLPALNNLPTLEGQQRSSVPDLAAKRSAA